MSQILYLGPRFNFKKINVENKVLKNDQKLPVFYLKIKTRIPRGPC